MTRLRITAIALGLLGSSFAIGQASAAMPVNGLAAAGKQISTNVEDVRWAPGQHWHGHHLGWHPRVGIDGDGTAGIIEGGIAGIIGNCTRGTNGNGTRGIGGTSGNRTRGIDGTGGIVGNALLSGQPQKAQH